MTLFTTLDSVLIIGFLVLAVAVSVASVAFLAEFVAANRRTRLARRETLGSYYRGLVLTH